MTQFEVGKEYEANDPRLSTIKVLGRTEHFIKVENDLGNQFRMKIRLDDGDIEYAYDSSVGTMWRIAATYQANMEV